MRSQHLPPFELITTWIKKNSEYALALSLHPLHPRSTISPPLNPLASEQIQRDLPIFLQTSSASAPLILGSIRMITLGLYNLLKSFISLRNSRLLAPRQFQQKIRSSLRILTGLDLLRGSPRQTHQRRRPSRHPLSPQDLVAASLRDCLLAHKNTEVIWG